MVGAEKQKVKKERKRKNIIIDLGVFKKQKLEEEQSEEPTTYTCHFSNEDTPQLKIDENEISEKTKFKLKAGANKKIKILKNKKRIRISPKKKKLKQICNGE